MTPLAQAMRHWTGHIRVCFDVRPVWYELSRIFFQFIYPFSSKNQSIYLNETVLSSLRRVEIHLRRIQANSSSFIGSVSLIPVSIRGQSIFFFSDLFILFLSKTKTSIWKNRTVDATNSNRLGSRHVEIHLRWIRDGTSLMIHMITTTTTSLIKHGKY